MRQTDAWMRRPSRECLWAFIAYGAMLTLLWGVVYGGANWVVSAHDQRVRLHLDWEMRVPFFPVTAVVYLSLFPMLWLSPFVIHGKERLREFAKALARLICVSGVGFLLLPSEDVRIHETVSGFSGWVFELADRINLDHNHFPSLHVGMAVLCARTFARTAEPGTAAAVWIWAMAISFSTLITHQHYVVDVFAGGLLGWWFTRSGKSVSRPFVGHV